MIIADRFQSTKPFPSFLALMTEFWSVAGVSQGGVLVHSTKATDRSFCQLLEKLREEYLCPQHRLQTGVLVSCLTNWGKRTCALNTGYRQELWSVAGETEGRILALSTRAIDRCSGLLLDKLGEEYLRPQHRLQTGVPVCCRGN